MADLDLQMNPQMEQIHGQIRDTMRTIANGFQKLDKIKDSNRQSKQLEDLTGKMRECKRLIKEFDREIKDEDSKNLPELNKKLNDEKQSMHFPPFSFPDYQMVADMIQKIFGTLENRADGDSSFHLSLKLEK